MSKKQGITITMLVITIIVLTILATVITVSVSSTIASSKFTTWITEITYIQEAVNDKLNATTAIDFVGEEVTINTSNLTTAEILEQFEDEVIDSNGNVTLKVLNLGKINITDTIYGNLTEVTDVYALSDTTKKVYYVKGMTSDGEVYYTLTESLNNRFKLTGATGELTSVVFKPSKIGYTNEPLSVEIMIPKDFANISVSCSNANVNVSGVKLVNGMYQYTVNTNSATGNYIVTVSYQKDDETLTETYEVNTYDITSPTINNITDEDIESTQTSEYITNITAEDASGIKHIKYYEGKVEETDVKAFFDANGKDVINGRIKSVKNIYDYTIYAEDNAGNFATVVVTIPAEESTAESVTDESSQTTDTSQEETSQTE